MNNIFFYKKSKLQTAQENETRISYAVNAAPVVAFYETISTECIGRCLATGRIAIAYSVGLYEKRYNTHGNLESH